MGDKVLLAALSKFQCKDEIPSSQFTAAQRAALDQFFRQTGSVRCLPHGCGATYRIINSALFAMHFSALSPGAAMPDTHLPLRARHIAKARSSKAGTHQHESYYLLLKAVGEGVCWREAERQVELPLDQATQDYGAATLLIRRNDSWEANGELWLVENQALFDCSDWLPTDTHGSLAYYGGQLNGILLKWLTARPRATKIIHFPDYDGVGLANFAKLYAMLGDTCEFWLMPNWSARLDRYGSAQLWRDTFRDFTHASQLLPKQLSPLIEQMKRTGLALEQEAVWL